MEFNRWRIFGVHLLATGVVLALVLGGLYYGWYAWPAWYLQGADSIFGLILLSTLVIGPLASLLVSTPNKVSRLLLMNLSVIVVLQLAALSLGGWALWQGRPLFYALTIDRIELITASQFDEASLEKAQEKSARHIPDDSTLLQWLWVPLPDDATERDGIIASAIMSGKDITGMPEYFRSWDEGLADLRSQLHPMPALSPILGLDEAAYQLLLKNLGMDAADMGWLNLFGNKRGGVMLFDRQSGRPLHFLARP